MSSTHCDKCGLRFVGVVDHGPPCRCRPGPVVDTLKHISILQEVGEDFPDLQDDIKKATQKALRKLAGGQ